MGLQKEINDIVRNGGNVTHFLKVKIVNQRTAEEGNEIRREIFQIIANKQHHHTVKGGNVHITWRTSAQCTTKIYHSDVRLWNDVGVKLHTVALLKEVIKALDAKFDQIFSRKITILSFWVTKPLSRDVCLD